MERKGFVRYQLPVIIWALVIFITSSIPQRAFPKIDIVNIDKVAHVIIYFLFCFLTYRALRHQNKYPLVARYSLLFSILVTVLYGATDEAHQLFVPGRSADLVDLAADLTGGLLALIAIGILARRHSSRAGVESRIL